MTRWLSAICVVLMGCASVAPSAPVAPGREVDKLALEAQQAFSQGETQRGLDLMLLALDFNRGTDRLAAAAQNLNDLGVMSLETGNPKAARRYLEDAHRLYVKLRDRRGGLSTRLNLASIEPAASLEELQAIVRDASVAGHKAVAGSAHNQLGKLAQADGDWDAATGYFRDAVALHRASGAGRGLSVGLHNLSRALWKTGRGDEGRARAQEAIAVDKAHEMWPYLARDLLLLGQILEDTDTQEAIRHYERAFYVGRYAGRVSVTETALEGIKRLGGRPPLSRGVHHAD